jgi:uncharacterized protein (DUF1697 family)
MLRGVNLGNRRIKMDALRAVYESLGLKDPQTYVQSGNVVFQTKERDLTRLTARIEAAIEKTFGFSSDVLLRTAPEMQDVIAKNPFAGRPEIVPAKLLVVFLSADPGEEARRQVRAIQAKPDELFIYGRELYIYFPNGQARPTLKFGQVEKAIKTKSTGRNWNSVTKLLEMAQALG